MLSLVVLVPLLLGTTQAVYNIQQTYDSRNFFDEFEFFTRVDPSHGNVQYANRRVAEQYNLIATKESSIPGADGSQKNVYFAGHDGEFDPNLAVSMARPSVRLTSKQNFTHALVIADIAHLPVAECGAWPAFWSTQPDNWPAGGEIDIIEGVNEQATNHIALHTSDACNMNAGYSQASGKGGATDCAVSTSGAGCAVSDPSPASYGEPFNAGHGGVYAMEWTADHIAVWWWARRDIPADVSAGAPNPRSWPAPVALFKGACDIDRHFAQQKIIFDITFCGDWAGQKDVWSATCAAKHGPSCSAYVESSKDGFKQAYWEIVSVKVYQDSDDQLAT